MRPCLQFLAWENRRSSHRLGRMFTFGRFTGSEGPAVLLPAERGFLKNVLMNPGPAVSSVVGEKLTERHEVSLRMLSLVLQSELYRGCVFLENVPPSIQKAPSAYSSQAIWLRFHSGTWSVCAMRGPNALAGLFRRKFFFRSTI